MAQVDVTRIPVFRPLLEAEEIRAVTEAIELGWLGMGSYVGRFEQAIHEGVHVVLQERFAAGDLDERTFISLDFGHDFVDRPFGSLVKRVRRIAPRAAQIARREPHEHAWLAGPRRLALDRVEDLVDREHDGKSSIPIILPS